MPLIIVGLSLIRLCEDCALYVHVETAACPVFDLESARGSPSKNGSSCERDPSHARCIDSSDTNNQVVGGGGERSFKGAAAHRYRRMHQLTLWLCSSDFTPERRTYAIQTMYPMMSNGSLPNAMYDTPHDLLTPSKLHPSIETVRRQSGDCHQFVFQIALGFQSIFGSVRATATTIERVCARHLCGVLRHFQ